MFSYLWRIIRFFAWSLPVSFVRKAHGTEWAWIDLLKVALEYEPMLVVPVVDLTDLYPEINRSPLASSQPGVASAKPSELVSLAWLASYLKPKLIVEIGTQRGGVSLLLAENAGPEAQVITFDILSPVDHPEIGSAFRNTPLENRIKFIQSDSLTFDWSSLRGQADLVYVDGCHDYDYVSIDTRNAFELLSERGVIVWHDFPSANGVRRCLMELGRLKRGVYHLRGTRLALFDPQKPSIHARPHWGLSEKNG